MNGTNTLLVAAGLLVSSLPTRATASPLEDGLIAWWRMELKQGDMIPDASGNGHDLTVYGNSLFSCQTVTFNDDGYLLADDADDLDLLGDWSVSYWVREDSNQHAWTDNPTNTWMNKIPAYHDASGGWHINASDPTGVHSTIYGSPNCNSYTENQALVHDQWYRLTTTFDSDSHALSIFFDDSLPLQFDVACTMLNNPFPVILGGELQIDLSPHPWCNGAMADVRIYDRVLSQSEVTELFAQGAPEGCSIDLDGDGVGDDQDECPESDLSTEIVIADCVTGVPNQLLGDGCTMADLLAQCAVGAQNHGAYVSCVAHLTTDWREAGLITSNERQHILNCAAQANIP